MKPRNLLIPVVILTALFSAACVTLPGESSPASTSETTPQSTAPTTTTGTPETTGTPSGTPIGTETAGDELNILVEGILTVGATTTVTVTWSDGSPAADSRVIVNGEDAGATDAEGTITITVPDDAMTVTITAILGDAEGQVEETVVDARLKVYVQGQANPGATAIVVVRTPAGTPAEGAEVTVNGEAVGTTDSDGKIAVDVPEDADRIEITVTFEGDEARTQKIVTEPHLEVVVDTRVTVETTTTVTVRRPDATPAGGAEVTVNGENVGSTDDRGQIVINIVDVGVLVIVARLDDLEGDVEADVGSEPTPEATLPPTPGAETTAPVIEELQIALGADLTDGALITLTITDSEGNPVEGATVALNGETLGTTDANGQMQFQVPAVPEFRFEAHADGSIGTLVIDLDG